MIAQSFYKVAFVASCARGRPSAEQGNDARYHLIGDDMGVFSLLLHVASMVSAAVFCAEANSTLQGFCLIIPVLEEWNRDM